MLNFEMSDLIHSDQVFFSLPQPTRPSAVRPVIEFTALLGALRIGFVDVPMSGQ